MIALSGCAASAAPRDPETLVDLIRADGASMNPLYAETVQDSIYNGLIFDGLTALDHDLAPVPWLATSWHTSDGLHWDVELRRGVTWSDGKPFTSRDVVFTYDLMRDPQVAFNGSSDVDYITSVVADGPYRVRFSLSHVSALFVPNALGEPMLPEHILGKVPPARQRFTGFGEHPVGTGSYMLERWQHDSEAVFVRNPHFWHGPAKIRTLDFRVIFNDQAELEALENGSADLIDDMGANDALQLEQQAPQIVVMTFPSLYVDTIEPNLRRPGLDEVPVRQAIMYGFDREAIAKGFFHGLVEPESDLIVPALTRWYDPHVMTYPYDPAKARALLDADGWKVGPDGIRRKGAHRLAFELLVNQGNVTVIDELLAFVADMRSIGIDLSLRQLDFASLTARTYAGNYDLIADARGGAIDPDWTPVLASWERPPAGANTTGYADPIVDRDLREGIRTLDYAKRRAIYDQMQQRLAQTLPMIVEIGRFAAAAHAPRLLLDPRETLQSPYIWYNVYDWKLAS